MRIRIQAVSCNADPHAYPDHWFSFPSLKLIQILTQVRGCLRSSGLTLATLFGVIGGVVFGLALRQRPEPWTDRWVSIFFINRPTGDTAFFFIGGVVFGLELRQRAEPLTDRWLSIFLSAASSLVWNSANDRAPEPLTNRWLSIFFPRNWLAHFLSSFDFETHSDQRNRRGKETTYFSKKLNILLIGNLIAVRKLPVES